MKETPMRIEESNVYVVFKEMSTGQLGKRVVNEGGMVSSLRPPQPLSAANI
jgi:hypothetical protein